MAKTKRRRKAKRQAEAKARQLTAGKLIRLTFKSMLFAAIVAILLVVLSFFGVPTLQNIWLQFGIMLVVYLIAYPFLMREFRPKTYLKKKDG